MERTTFGLLFYIRRDKTNKKGEAPVFMRLTINGERADASIKRFIEPHAWNSAKGKANEKSRGGKDLNLYLDAISANILRIQRDLELDKKEVSAQIILNRQRKVQGAVGYQPRPGNGDPLRNHATADRGVSAKELSKRGLLSG